MKMNLVVLFMSLFGTVKGFGHPTSIYQNWPTQLEDQHIVRAEKGGADPSGGDAAGLRGEALVELIGLGKDIYEGTNVRIKRKVKNVLAMNYVHPIPGEVGTLLQTLIDQGLLQDVDEAKYVLSDYCHENGIEKSSHTLLIDRRKDKNLPAPDICINIRKLAAEDAKENEIVGLLIHEHIRHLGQEDTNRLKIHPSLVAIAKNYALLDPDFGEIHYLSKGVVAKISKESTKHVHVKVISHDISKADYSVEGIRKNCTDVRYSQLLFFTDSNYSKYLVKLNGSLEYAQNGYLWDTNYLEKSKLVSKSFVQRDYQGYALPVIKIQGSNRVNRLLPGIFGFYSVPSTDCEADLVVSYDNTQLFRSWVNTSVENEFKTKVEFVGPRKYLQ